MKPIVRFRLLRYYYTCAWSATGEAWQMVEWSDEYQPCDHYHTKDAGLSKRLLRFGEKSEVIQVHGSSNVRHGLRALFACALGAGPQDVLHQLGICLVFRPALAHGFEEGIQFGGEALLAVHASDPRRLAFLPKLPHEAGVEGIVVRKDGAHIWVPGV